MIKRIVCFGVLCSLFLAAGHVYAFKTKIVNNTDRQLDYSIYAYDNVWTDRCYKAFTGHMASKETASVDMGDKCLCSFQAFVYWKNSSASEKKLDAGVLGKQCWSRTITIIQPSSDTFSWTWGL